MNQIVEDEHGIKWSLNGERMEGLLRKAAFFRATLENSQVTTSRESLLQKLRLAGPLAEVDQNLKQIDSMKARLGDQYRADILNLKKGGWEDLQYYLAQKRAQVEKDKASVKGMFRSASDINQAAVQSAETGIKVATGVRDASVASLGIIATVSTGGTISFVAAGVAGVGKGAATYQDTGDWTKAIADGAFVAIPLGVGQGLKMAKTAGHVSKGVVTTTTLVFDIGAEVGTECIVNEKDLETAMVNALLKQGVSQIETAALAPLKTEIGKKIKSSVMILNDHSGKGSNRATPLIVETIKKLGHKAGSAITSPKTRQEKAADAIDRARQMQPGIVPVPMAPMQWVQSHVLRRA